MHDWSQIATRYGSLVWKTAYRVLRNDEDALEVHQEVFVDVLRRVNDRAVDNWPALLRWLTVRRAMDRVRRANRLRSTAQEDDHLLVESDPGQSMEWDELIAVLRSELNRIPVQQAEVFWLHHIEELSQSEIASQLQLTINHVRVLIHRARVHLRESLTRRHPSFVEGQSHV